MSRLEYLFMRFNGFDRLIDLACLVVLTVMLGRPVGRWVMDQLKPHRSVPARVAARRAEIKRHKSRRGREFTTVCFCVTFEAEDGACRELSVSSTEYSGLDVGDCGTLTYQGGHYLGFVSERRQGTGWTDEREETEEEEG